MTEYRMPNGAKELRIKHFGSMAVLPSNGFQSDRDKILFLSEFTGLPYNKILDFTVGDIQKMVLLATKGIAQMNLAAPLPKTIVLKGQRFNLVDPDKIGIGWHIDYQNSSIKKDPVKLACLFYVPEGFNYSDVDENGNLTHPRDARYDLFADEFPLDLFIRCASFFLRKSLRSTWKLTARSLAQHRTIKRIGSVLRSLHLFSGKRP